LIAIVESAELQVTDLWWLRELRIEELVIALGLVKTPESEESTASAKCCELGCGDSTAAMGVNRDELGFGLQLGRR
jgi:hypothetical protein